MSLPFNTEECAGGGLSGEGSVAVRRETTDAQPLRSQDKCFNSDVLLVRVRKEGRSESRWRMSQAWPLLLAEP